MAYLRHDSGGPATLKNRQVLGEDSPLEFDEHGYAGPVDDDAATMLAAMDTHVEVAGPPPDADEDEDTAVGEADEQSGAADTGADEDDVEFDAAAFVDRTPMDAVVADIESGDYDEHLDAIAAAEAEGRDRDGVTEAIDDRRG